MTILRRQVFTLLLQRGGQASAYFDADSNMVARQIFFTGLAVGIRPCAGALFVLIAALDQGIFGFGIVSTRSRWARASPSPFASSDSQA